MKVTDIGRSEAIENEGGIRRDKPQAPSDAFAQLLETALASQETPEATDSEHILALRSGMVPGVYAPERGARGEEEAILDAAMERVDRIENLVRDTDGTPKGVDNLLQALSQEADGLREDLSRLPEDHPVRQWGEEFSILSYVESVKWRRGDYS